MLTFSQVARADVLSAGFAPMINAACDASGGKFEPVDIFRALERGDWQLWATQEGEELRAILMTRLVSYPSLKACEMLAAVGSDREETMLPFLAAVEDWARREGCQLMQPIARPGWERALGRHGYAKTHVMLEKRL